MLFIEYPKCTTCQKARKWLVANEISFQSRHIREEAPSADELKSWHSLSGLPLKKFFNTSGLKYKERICFLESRKRISVNLRSFWCRSIIQQSLAENCMQQQTIISNCP